MIDAGPGPGKDGESAAPWHVEPIEIRGVVRFVQESAD